jgi:hypothetical protein
MSEALRALAEASDASFDQPPGGMPSEDTGDSSATQAPEPPTQVERPEPESGEQPETEARGADDKGKKLSKFELAKHKADREKKAKESENQRFQKAQAKAAQAEKEKAELTQKYREQEARIAAMEQQQRVNSDPILKQATDLVQKRYAPEDLEREAARLEAQGDHEGASTARAIARQMQNVVADQQAQQQAQEQQQAQGSWRQYEYGTEKFDDAAGQLKQGTQEFSDCWATAETNLVQQRDQSQDPWDKECAKQFRDKNSEFGKRMQYFLTQTAYGRGLSKHALGILPAFDIVKMSMVIDTQRGELTKLRNEVKKLRGFTSPGAGAPVNGSNGHSRGFDPNRFDVQKDSSGKLTRQGEVEFAKLSPDQMRQYLRSRETD